MKRMHLWISFAVLTAAMLAVAIWAYPRLPAMAPTHWDAQGHVNGWMPRFWAAAIWPLLMAGLALLFAVLPAISPRRFEIRPFARSYDVVVLVILAFLLVVGTSALLAAAGHAVSIALVAPVAVGALFVVIGNFMGKFRKNFFVGIRTPWTLASDEVWARTHRLGGWLFVLAGLVWIVAGVLHASPALLVAVALLAGLVPAVASFFWYRRIEGQPPSRGAR